ncbi:unnamed protein product [Chrysoparadoxa australica]
MDHLVLDVDGVLLDSNEVKENAIRQSAKPFTNATKLDEFVEYYTSLNGVPREIKVEFFFGVNTEETKQILATYNEFLSKALLEVSLTKGAKTLLDQFHGNCPIHAVSGGAQDEVKHVLSEKGIAHYFDNICGGPTSKSDHLKQLDLKGEVTFVGDSQHDYEVATEYGFQFVFLHGYTQFDTWKEFFQPKKDVKIFNTLADWPITL